MVVARPVWCWSPAGPGYIDVTIDNRDRFTDATVHVPPGYIGRVDLVAYQGAEYSRDFPAGDTRVAINPPQPQDTFSRVGMEVFPAPVV